MTRLRRYRRPCHPASVPVPRRRRATGPRGAARAASAAARPQGPVGGVAPAPPPRPATPDPVATHTAGHRPASIRSALEQLSRRIRWDPSIHANVRHAPYASPYPRPSAPLGYAEPRPIPHHRQRGLRRHAQRDPQLRPRMLQDRAVEATRHGPGPTRPQPTVHWPPRRPTALMTRSSR